MVAQRNISNEKACTLTKKVSVSNVTYIMHNTMENAVASLVFTGGIKSIGVVLILGETNRCVSKGIPEQNVNTLDRAGQFQILGVTYFTDALPFGIRYLDVELATFAEHERNHHDGKRSEHPRVHMEHHRARIRH